MAYKVPFVNYPLQYRNMKAELDTAITKILATGQFILRDDLITFEKNVASFLGVKYTIGVHNGTDALFFSLLAAGVGPGDEVITPAHTFVATVAGISHCGATPVLIDIGEDMNMDLDQLESLITPKTKAIIPVHLNGRLCDMKKLMNIANKHNLIVIEDAAQALGATYAGKKGGTFGLTSCFSFYPAKILGTAGDGGLIATNDEKLVNKFYALRDNGRVPGNSNIEGYGYNSRLDNLHAAILNVKLAYVPKWVARRRELAKLYHKGLSNIAELKLPPPPTQEPYFDVYQNYVIRTQKRNELAEYLRNSGVEILISWPVPLHKQPGLGLSHFKLPKTEQISNEVISLPMYPELTNEQVEYVIKLIHGFFSV